MDATFSTSNDDEISHEMEEREKLNEVKNSKNSDLKNNKSDDNLRNKQCLRPQFLVYISHFISSWGDRMWMFAGGLFLIEISPDSLRLVAIYGAALAFTVIILGSAIGRYVDRTSRLTCARNSLLLQNIMVCICAVFLCLNIAYKDYLMTSFNGSLEIFMQGAVILTSCLAQIGALGSKIAIEKDWIVVISDKDDAALSNMNSVLRTVDLSTQILAPVLVGFIMSYQGMITGGIVIAVWIVFSTGVEYALLLHLFKTISALRDKTFEDSQSEDVRALSFKDRILDAAATWKKYFNHTVRDAGLSLALLYMTVLSLDNYSRAYVSASGVGKGVLGILTACASLSGIFGAIAFPLLRKRIGILKTGVFGYSFQTSCLILSAVSVFLPGTLFAPFSSTLSEVKVEYSKNLTLADEDSTHSNVNDDDISDNAPSVLSPILLLVGIIVSRFGLWIADLSVTQLLQISVSPSLRGGINGVQSSINQLFGLLMNFLIIMWPRLESFGALVLASFCFVFSGLLFFSSYAYRNRGRKVKYDSGPDEEKLDSL